MNPLKAPDFKSIFESAPGLYLILSKDLTIIAVSNAYLKATMTVRNSIVSHGLFEIFPDNPDDKDATGVSNLQTSLNYVKEYGQPHTMAVQKYDIRRPDGTFEVRYWSPLNTPVFNDQHELVYIIHKVIDVTSSYVTQNKLHKSEKDYELLVNSIKDYAIFMINLDGCVASWNSGAEKIKGYTSKEIIGKPIDIFYSEEAIKNGEPAKNLQLAREKGSYESEGWRLRKDGTLFWANIVFTALRDEQNLLYGYSKITRDITERKKSEEQLELLSRQINQSNDAIFTTDANRKIKSWNKGAQNLYGYSIEDVLGQDSHMLLRSALTQAEIELLIKQIALKDYWSGELRRKTKSGRDIYVLSSVTTLRDNKGIITGYVAVSFDVTEQKRLREQVNYLANLMEHSSEAIISRGMDRQLISWNKGAQELFGYTKEEVIGKKASEIGFVKFTEEEITALESELKAQGTCKFEKTYFHKNGTSIYCVVTANIVRNENEDSLVFIIKDISSRRQWEDHLKNANEELEEKVKLRTEEIFRSEKNYHQLFDNNPLPVWVLDAKTFRFLAVNEMAIIHYGYSREEFLSMTAIDIRPEEDKESFIRLDHSDDTVNKIYNRGIWRHKLKNGKIIFVEIIAHQIIFEGIPARIILAHDITERKKIEDQLKASETRFRALIENSNDIISLMDDSFNLLYRSPAAARITGWSNEDMLGIDATTNIHTDDKLYAASIVKEVIANPAKIIYTKFRMRHKSGHYLWVEGTLTNLLKDTNVRAVVFNFRDITERVLAEQQIIQSEENLKAIFDNTSEGFVLLDINGNIKTYNKWAAKRLLTNIDIPIQINRSIFDYIEESRKDFFAGILKKILLGEIIEYERLYVKKGCPNTWIHFSYTPVRKDKVIVGICITARDITEKKQSEQQKEFDHNNLHALINNTQDLIWSVDQKLKLITYNDAFERVITKLTREPLLKGSYVMIPQLTQEQVSRYKRYYKRAFKGESFKEIEFTSYPAEFWSEISFYPIVEDNVVIGTACFSRNITDRKKAEQELQKSYAEKQSLAERMAVILNTLPANIALLDEKGVIIEVNEAWKKFGHENGLNRGNYGIGENYINISKSAAGNERKDGMAVAKGIGDVLKNKTREFIYEYPCHSPEYQRWFRMVVTPLSENNFRGAVAMHVDITELRWLEKERMRSKTEEQQKITRAMLSGQEKERHNIGIELHDNVNQILVSAKLLLSYSKNKQGDITELIDSSMGYIQDAISENRKIAHVFVSPDETETLVEQLMKLSRTMLEISGIQVKFNCKNWQEENLGKEKKINIYRIVQEQCTNIVKYAKATKVQINLITSDDNFYISIKDNGVGMDSTVKKTGIGLKNIADRLLLFDGTSHITTEPDKGFCMEIVIPL